MPEIRLKYQLRRANMVKVRNLKDLSIYLTSSDYRERMVGEILELDYRIKKLEYMLKRSDEERGFKFTTPKHLLEAQVSTMKSLRNILEIRATLENISLPEVEYEIQ